MKGPSHKDKLVLEVWVKPGAEITIEDLKEKFAGRILRVNDNDEILIAVQEVSHS